MEQKNTENCTNVCKLTNCRLPMLILTNQKQDEVLDVHVKQSRGQVMDTVQGWHFAEQVRGLHIRLSLEKSQHKKGSVLFTSVVFTWSPFIFCSLLSFLRLTSTFYFENHTGLNVPSHKEKEAQSRVVSWQK